MSEEKRAFKGIWIPKEIWLNKDLTLQEKIILVEIDSLDNDNGCFASNKYFSDFFGISTGRISQIINDLSKKGYLNIEYQKKDKQILGRVIKIQSPPFPKVFRKLNRGYLENDDGGIKYSKEGYLENAKDNNIYINNIINNNISSCIYLEEQFARTISPLEYEKITQWEETFTDDIINYAIDKAVLNNIKTFNYVEGILRNWKTCNYKTLQEIKDNEEKRYSKEEVKKQFEETEDYNWLEEE